MCVCVGVVPCAPKVHTPAVILLLMEINRFVLGKVYIKMRSILKYQNFQPLTPKWGSLGLSQEFSIAAPIERYFILKVY